MGLFRSAGFILGWLAAWQSLPATAQERAVVGEDDSIVINGVIELPKQQRALKNAVASYIAIDKAINPVDKSISCDIRVFCADESYSIHVTPFYVQFFSLSPFSPPVKKVTFPIAALATGDTSSATGNPKNDLNLNYIKFQEALFDYKRAARRGSLYEVPGVDDNPFLPWPPKYPSTSDDVTGSFSTQQTLGGIASNIKGTISKKGYNSLLYFSVPGGFAVSTQLERVARDGNIKPDQRWTTGKRGGAVSWFDYLSKLLRGENDRFRIFVFIITDENIAPRDEATSYDLQSWKSSGRLSLSKQRASTRALPNTRVWLYTYEFQATRGRDATLIQNRSDALGPSENRKAVGLP